MNKLDKLIEKLCPNGVEYVELGEVCIIKRGIRITKNELTNDGQYPVVSGGIGYMGYTNKFNRESNTITIAQYGTAGYVNLQPEKFWANDVCFSIFPRQNICNKYLFYFLANKQEYLYSISNRNAIPYSIDRKKILKIKIPLPPLPVQEEIARILDNFTELTAELTAEFTVRQKQYEYYRNKLLNFKELKNE